MGDADRSDSGAPEISPIREDESDSGAPEISPIRENESDSGAMVASQSPPRSSRMMRRSPALLSYTMLMVVAGIGLIVFALTVPKSTETTIAEVAGILLLGLGSFVPLLSYLQVGRVEFGPAALEFGKESSITKVHDEGSSAAADKAGPAIGPQELEQLMEGIRKVELAALQTERHQASMAALSDNIFHELARLRGQSVADQPSEQQTTARVEEHSSVEEQSLGFSLGAQTIESRSVNARRRLSHEIDILGRRINLNLVIGIFTTTLALVALLILVVGLPHKSNTFDWNYAIPRLALAVFIQGFAFFFLRLYKSGLDDLKYYQNEITNLDMWSLGADLANLSRFDETNSSSDVSILRTVVNQLARVERNRNLKKGESTVALEREKLEAKTGVDLADAILKLARKEQQ